MMKPWLIFAAILILLGPAALQGAEPAGEQQFIGVLQSGASPQEKDAACVRLKRIGTAQSVPALAALLPDQDLSQSARYALESMPAPEAGRALLEALDKTTGLIEMGIIQSLGQRRETGAAPRLIKLLADADPNVAGAVAASLGRIGGADAITALQAALPKSQELVVRAAILQALLRIADQQLRASTRPGSAFKLFEWIDKTASEDHIRVAACRGMIRSAGRRALTLVIEGLQGADGPARVAAMQMAREITDPAATKAYVKLLPKLEPALQVALIGALQQRGDTGAAPAVLAISNSPDPGVRVAALRALADLGDAAAAPRLVEAACAKDDAEKKAARQTLLDLRRGAVADALLRQLVSDKPQFQSEAVRALVGRGEKEVVPQLLDLAQKDGPAATRQAACKALGPLADAPQVAPLVRLVLEAKSESARVPPAEALVVLCGRLQERRSQVDAQPIVDGLASADVAARAALLPAASVLVDERIRAALRSSARAADPALRDAAMRALADSRDPELMPDLLALARQPAAPGLRVVMIRGYLRLAAAKNSAALTPAQRVGELEQILPLAQSADVKWLVLAGLAKIHEPEALTPALAMLDDGATRAEAAQAVMQIAAGIKSAHAGQARDAYKKVLAVTADATVRQAVEGELKQLADADGAAIKAVRIDPAIGAGKDTAPAPKESETMTIDTTSPVRFHRTQLDPLFRSEGVAVADFNNDGKMDVATGTMLYLGPDWKPQPMLAAPKSYPPEGYSNEFYCWAEDFNHDGWMDLIVVGFPGARTRWLENPGKTGGPWKEHLAIEKTGNESPDWVDLFKDGKKELVFFAEQGTAYARPGADPTQPWPITVIAGPNDPRPAGHGLGVGDINGDGRLDILCPAGWWEQPATPGKLPWTFHPAKLGYDNPAQMCVYDVNGDGKADVLSSAAHRYGLWWYEQTPQGWIPHEIDHTISQMHALHLADINGDGLLDIVSGKRFWAHREGDEGINDPAVLCWYELQRKDGKPAWKRHIIDTDSGVGLHVAIADVNGDGLLDIVTSSKKGVYVFTQERRK